MRTVWGWIIYIIGLLWCFSNTANGHEALWIMFIGWFIIFRARLKEGNTTNKNPKPPFI